MKGKHAGHFTADDVTALDAAISQRAAGVERPTAPAPETPSPSDDRHHPPQWPHLTPRGTSHGGQLPAEHSQPGHWLGEDALPCWGIWNACPSRKALGWCSCSVIFSFSRSQYPQTTKSRWQTRCLNSNATSPEGRCPREEAPHGLPGALPADTAG